MFRQYSIVFNPAEWWTPKKDFFSPAEAMPSICVPILKAVETTLVNSTQWTFFNMLLMFLNMFAASGRFSYFV